MTAQKHRVSPARHRSALCRRDGAIAAFQFCRWLPKRSDEVPKKSAEASTGPDIDCYGVRGRKVFATHAVEFTTVQEASCDSAKYGPGEHIRRLVPHSARIDRNASSAFSTPNLSDPRH